MTAARDEAITALSQRITDLEMMARERIAMSDAYMKRVEEIRVEIKEIQSRVHSAERSIDVIQTRMAVITAMAAILGSVIGQVVMKVALSL